MCRTEFRECFHLYARQQQVHSVDQLAVIMRSLRLSPTSTELKRYLKQKGPSNTAPAGSKHAMGKRHHAG